MNTRRHGRTALGVITALATASIVQTATAGPTLIFSDDFEASTVKKEWTWGLLTKTSNLTQFGGRYSNNSVGLRLNAPDAGKSSTGTDGEDTNRQSYTLQFDFYCLDSWDGNDPKYGKDQFAVSVNSADVFRATFDNVWSKKSDLTPDMGPVDLGFKEYPDSIFRKITVGFELPVGVNPLICFYDSGLQGVNDESWGIDNVKVFYNGLVPAPGTLAAAPMLGLAALRRRRTR